MFGYAMGWPYVDDDAVTEKTEEGVDWKYGCDHEYVNVSFNHIKNVCRFCDREKVEEK